MNWRIGIVVVLMLCTACTSRVEKPVSQSTGVGIQEQVSETETSPPSADTKTTSTVKNGSKVNVNLNSLAPKSMKVSQFANEVPMRAIGDLNKDGIDDVVVVADTEDPSLERNLVIYLGNGNGDYILAVNAKGVIMCKECGGAAYADPVLDLEITNGSIIVDGAVGSSSGEKYKYRFKYTNEDWFLIGYTDWFYSYNTGEASERDLNLLTGDFIYKTGKSMDSLKVSEKGKKPPRELVKLVDFHGDPYNDALYKLETSGDYGMITVSPNGKLVFFVKLPSDYKEGDLVDGHSYIQNLDSLETVEVLGINDYIGYVLWSNDSKYIFVDGGTSVGRSGHLYTASAEKLKAISYSGRASFSPDSTKLAYSSGELNDVETIAVGVDGDAASDVIIYDITNDKDKQLLLATPTTDYGVDSWIGNGTIKYYKTTYSMANDKLSSKEDVGEAIVR
jgi:hypothetical protein